MQYGRYQPPDGIDLGIAELQLPQGLLDFIEAVDVVLVGQVPSRLEVPEIFPVVS